MKICTIFTLSNKLKLIHPCTVHKRKSSIQNQFGNRFLAFDKSGSGNKVPKNVTELSTFRKIIKSIYNIFCFWGMFFQFLWSCTFVFVCFLYICSMNFCVFCLSFCCVNLWVSFCIRDGIKNGFFSAFEGLMFDFKKFLSQTFSQELFA